jgi:flagellar motor switch protein FliG
MSESTNEQQNIFINGRQQIIDMLQFMNEDEKQKLLSNIKQRNSLMAKELSEQSFSFKSLFQLSNESLGKIFSRVNHAIIGLALYPMQIELQRKALSILNRDQAEKAYSVMSQDLSSKKAESKRAQEKIIQIAIQLSRQNYINL